MTAAVEKFMGREMAWHRLGIVKGRAFGREDIEHDAPEILMNVRFEPTYVYMEDTEEFVETPLKGAIVRDDGRIVGEGLGKDTYGLVQSTHALEWGEQIASLATFPLVSAGTIREGRQFFFTFDVGTCDSPLGNLSNHLTVASSHDGTIPLMALHSSTIVVCANTLAIAMNSAHSKTTLRHTAHVEDRLKAAINAIKDTKEHLDDTIEFMEQLDTVYVDDVGNFVSDVVGYSSDMEDGRKKTQVTNARDAIMELWRSDMADGLSAHSGLRVVQAVNTYENWGSKIRGIKGRDTEYVRAERQFDAMVKGKMPLTEKAVQRVLVNA